MICLHTIDIPVLSQPWSLGDPSTWAAKIPERLPACIKIRKKPRSMSVASYVTVRGAAQLSPRSAAEQAAARTGLINDIMRTNNGEPGWLHVPGWMLGC